MNKIIIAGIITLLALGGYGAYSYYGQDKEDLVTIQTQSPSPTQTPVITASQKEIGIDVPQNSSQVSAVFVVEGMGRAFENQMQVRVRTSQKTLIEKPVMLQGAQMGEFGKFSVTFDLSSFKLASGTQLFIDAFEYSAKDGSQIHTDTRTVFFSGASTTMVVKVFFSDERRMNANCADVTASTRIIPRTEAVGAKALEELLKGPITQERGLGLATNIPAGTKLLKLRIESGTAYADFSEELDKNIGGSCRVSAIRAQITQTLKQFSNIRNVVISVQGRVDDVL